MVRQLGGSRRLRVEPCQATLLPPLRLLSWGCYSTRMAQNTFPAAAATFDVREIAVTCQGVQYGRVIAYSAVPAIGPARNGHVLVTDVVGQTLEVFPAQLALSA